MRITYHHSGFIINALLLLLLCAVESSVLSLDITPEYLDNPGVTFPFGIKGSLQNGYRNIQLIGGGRGIGMRVPILPANSLDPSKTYKVTVFVSHDCSGDCDPAFLISNGPIGIGFHYHDNAYAGYTIPYLQSSLISNNQRSNWVTLSPNVPNGIFTRRAVKFAAIIGNTSISLINPNTNEVVYEGDTGSRQINSTDQLEFVIGNDNENESIRWYGAQIDISEHATLNEEELKFSWDIIPYSSETVVTFNGDNDKSEILFKYNVSKQLLKAKILKSDCQTLADDVTAITISEIDDTSEINSLTHKNATIVLDVNQTSIASSDYWEFTSADNSTGRMEFCIRLDLTLADGTTSVTFHETLATVDINMTKSFEILGISTDREEAKNTEANTKLDYYTYAYQCNTATGGDIKGQPEAVLKQGSFVGICVKTNGTGVVVSDIGILFLNQTIVNDNDVGTVSATAVENGVNSEVTLVDCSTNPGTCFVKTQVLSKFFATSSPGDIFVYGTAVLAFQSSRRVASRVLQEEPGNNAINDAFQLQMQLESNSDEETGYEQHDSVNEDTTTALTSGALCFSTGCAATAYLVVLSMWLLL